MSLNPFTAKPGETINGLGIDFASRLAAGEALASVIVTPDSGITVIASSVDGTNALASVSIAANQPDGDLSILYTATGNAGSVRKGWRTILVRVQSN